MLLLIAPSGYAVGKIGIALDRWMAPPPVALKTLPVDLGEVDAVVTECGSLESAENVAVKCQVEALVSLAGFQRDHDAADQVEHDGRRRRGDPEIHRPGRRQGVVPGGR